MVIECDVCRRALDWIDLIVPAGVIPSGDDDIRAYRFMTSCGCNQTVTALNELPWLRRVFDLLEGRPTLSSPDPKIRARHLI